MSVERECSSKYLPGRFSYTRHKGGKEQEGEETKRKREKGV